MIVALAGGVGGAKLAHGLANTLPPEECAFVVNTGDDFEHLGLHISPDIDTVTYTLAGMANPELGWGVDGETWAFMEMLGRLGDEVWFRLGDRDLATHVHRTRRLRAGETLSEVTAGICQNVNIKHEIVPMTDDSVRTICESGGRLLAFQEYFVRYRCEPVVDRFVYHGADEAALSPKFDAFIKAADLEGIVICPSNPFLSIAPILALRGVRERLRARRFPTVAVSPIISGTAVKGPAAKIFKELGRQASCVGVAEFYGDLIDILIIDESDGGHAEAIRRLGIEPIIAPILMKNMADRVALAQLSVAQLRRRARHAA